MTNLFQKGNFRLHSGALSSYKIDCDALTNEDWECLAYLLMLRLPAFGALEGVPRGGLRLAEKMQVYKSSGPLLIVDDVFTTGKSIEQHRANRVATGAVVFARSKPPSWITPLFVFYVR